MVHNIAVLGEGSWGTALATVLADNGYTVKLWCHDPHVKKSIEQTGINNRYAPHIVLSNRIIPSSDLETVVADCLWIVETIPVIYLRNVLNQCKPFITPNQRWIITSKGIENESLLLPTELVDDVFDFSAQKVVLMGPSFASEVLQKALTVVTISATDCQLALEAQKLFVNSYFLPTITLDSIGVQLCAALKNVIGVGLGMLESAGHADNTRAFFCTRGLQEIKQLCVASGGKPETVYGLSGVGDLMLSVIGKHSKNVEVGRQLGKSISLQEIINKTGYTPEGINTIRSVNALIKNKNLMLPVCQGIYQIIFEQKSINDFLQELISKPLEIECL